MSSIKLWKCDGCGKTAEVLLAEPQNEPATRPREFPPGGWWTFWRNYYLGDETVDICDTCMEKVGVTEQRPAKRTRHERAAT